MDEDQKPKRYHYKVTLKTGEYSTFPNDNNFENYEDRLISGVYGITTKDGTTQITPDTVASIEKIEVKED